MVVNCKIIEPCSESFEQYRPPHLGHYLHVLKIALSNVIVARLDQRESYLVDGQKEKKKKKTIATPHSQGHKP